MFSDVDLNPTAEKLSVHKITTLNIEEEIQIADNKVSIIKNNLIKNVKEIDIFSQDVERLKDDIIAGKGTFDLQYADKIFENLGIKIIRGGTSAQKADVVLDIGYNGQLFKNEGFGIKSYLGARPTLLNASGGNTNFVYELVDFKEKYLEEVNAINSSHKIKDRIAKIINKGSRFQFSHVEAQTMQNNLAILDDAMPLLISQMLINFYLNRISSIDENLTNLVKNNPEFKSNEIGLHGYQIKIRRFLVAILLGMFTGKKWDGKFTSNGSIVVKQSGSQVAFHIVKLDVLENYLLKTIKFDTPSTTRHRFASVYRERDGKFYFKLNLQLRY